MRRTSDSWVLPLAMPVLFVDVADGSTRPKYSKSRVFPNLRGQRFSKRRFLLVYTRKYKVDVSRMFLQNSVDLTVQMGNTRAPGYHSHVDKSSLRSTV